MCLAGEERSSPFPRALAVPSNRNSSAGKRTRAITADTELRLGQSFGTSPEIQLDLQSDCELRVARRTVWKDAGPTVKARVA
jgi:plasmid maintenance system antidote protein VapI